jgi:uncharacterized RDD family membrane protein YckC
MNIEYPSILRRYLSSFLDGCLVLALFILIPYIIGDGENTLALRIYITIVLVFIYEPLFTSKLCTLGQKITGIRVRNYQNYNNIGYFAALYRYLLKGILGFISLFSIVFSKDKRAIHDFAVDSIVIMKMT